MSGNDFLNKNVLRWRWKVDRDVAEVISSGSWFHVWGPETENARLPIVDSLTAGTVILSDGWWLQSAKPVGQAGQRHGQMVPDIAVPYHSWLCRSAERSYTLCALVSAASGDRRVHQWCDQKISAGTSYPSSTDPVQSIARVHITMGSLWMVNQSFLVPQAVLSENFIEICRRHRRSPSSPPTPTPVLLLLVLV